MANNVSLQNEMIKRNTYYYELRLRQYKSDEMEKQCVINM